MKAYLTNPDVPCGNRGTGYFCLLERKNNLENSKINIHFKQSG